MRQVAGIKIHAVRSPLKNLYLNLLIAVLGKAVPAAAQAVPEVRREAECFPTECRILFAVWPDGPALNLVSDGSGGLFRETTSTEMPDLSIRIKSCAAAFRLFTFRESTAGAEAAGRLIAAGELPMVLAFIRIMDQVEMLLLPRPIARRAVKRWRPPAKLLSQRLRIYLALLLPSRRRR